MEFAHLSNRSSTLSNSEQLSDGCLLIIHYPALDCHSIIKLHFHTSSDIKEELTCSLMNSIWFEGVSKWKEVCSYCISAFIIIVALFCSNRAVPSHRYWEDIYVHILKGVLCKIYATSFGWCCAWILRGCSAWWPAWHAKNGVQRSDSGFESI